MGAKSINPAGSDDVPVGDEELASNQEAVPLPYLAGRRRIALRWIEDAVDIESVQAPDDKPGKK